MLDLDLAEVEFADHFGELGDHFDVEARARRQGRFHGDRFFGQGVFPGKARFTARMICALYNAAGLANKGGREVGERSPGRPFTKRRPRREVRRLPPPRPPPRLRPRPHPHIVKRRAAERRDALVAGQRVDPLAVEEFAIVPQPLADDEAARARRVQLHMQAQFSARVADFHHVAFAKAELGRVGGVHQGARPDLLGARGRGLVEARIEKAARRRGRELERMLFVGRLVDRPMVGERGQLAPRPAHPVVGVRDVWPVGAKMELPVLMGEAVEEVRLLEGRLAVDPTRRLQFGERPAARGPERFIDDLARRHREAAVFCPQAPGQRANHLVVGAAILRRLDRLRRELQMLVRARGIEVVVLQEHRRRQNDVGVARGVGHELLMHDDK